MNSLNISGTVDDSGNNMKDYRFVNGDFEGGISVPTAVFTSKGRASIGKAYGEFGANTFKVVDDTVMATIRGGNISEALKYSDIAKNNYDNAKEIYELTGIYPDNYNPYAHEQVAYEWGKYVGNPAIAFLFRGTGEGVIQPIQYGTIYNQQEFSRSMYDPFGQYHPANGGYAPDKYGTEGSMSGTGYWKDSWQDTLNVLYGAQGKTFIPPNENSK